MRDKIDALLAEIKAEAKQAALGALVSEMVENADGLWGLFKSRCGEKEAALAVICLLQAAADDGHIVATKFANPEDENDSSIIPLRLIICDEYTTMIEGTGGICIEVAEKSNA